MEGRQVSAGNGWAWMVEGFGLFKKTPVIWIALFIIYLLLGMMLSLVKMVGPILLNLLAPVFLAGFMLGCCALDNDEELEINHLFAGFRQNTTQLITLGGVYLAGIIVIVGIMFFGSSGGVMTAIFSGQMIDPQQTAATLGDGFIISALIGLVLMVPLIMAYWFAPALVVFHGIAALEAMQLSFQACMRNMLPLFVYSLISAALLVVAIIPLGLGLLVMIPTMTASLYASYKDIFAITEVPQVGETEEA